MSHQIKIESIVKSTFLWTNQYEMMIVNPWDWVIIPQQQIWQTYQDLTDTKCCMMHNARDGIRDQIQPHYNENVMLSDKILSQCLGCL